MSEKNIDILSSVAVLVDDSSDDDEEVPVLVNMDLAAQSSNTPTGSNKNRPTIKDNYLLNPDRSPTESGTTKSNNCNRGDTNDNNNNELENENHVVSSSQSKVPVTILTGFLGSGKTSLIQHILHSPDHGKRIAIIENEFSGSTAAAATATPTPNMNNNNTSNAEKEGLNIETLIARDGTRTSSNNYDSSKKNLLDLIELPNGCICCTVKDTLVETLEKLIEAKKDELDYIIIECSGMANPGPIASIFWLDDALESRLTLDGIITCVDARNLRMQLVETSSQFQAQNKNYIDCDDDNDDNDENYKQYDGEGDIGGDEAAQQIAFADRIIINKIDLLEENSMIQQVIDQVRLINSTAPIITTKYSIVKDINWIIDANCFDVERAKEVEATFDLIDKQQERMSTSSIKNDENCSDANCFKCTTITNPSYNIDITQGEFCMPCISSAPSPSPSPSPSPPFEKKTTTFNHKHTNAITTIALIQKGSINLKLVHTWLASILWPDQDKEDKVLKEELDELEKLDQITIPEISMKRRKQQLLRQMLIFRIKGILSVKNHDLQHEFDNDDVVDDDDEGELLSFVVSDDCLDRRRFIVQAVNDLWEIHPANESLCWSPDEERICKLVFIGRNLNYDQLQSGFESCFNADESILS